MINEKTSKGMLHSASSIIPDLLLCAGATAEMRVNAQISQAELAKRKGNRVWCCATVPFHGLDRQVSETLNRPRPSHVTKWRLDERPHPSYLSVWEFSKQPRPSHVQHVALYRAQKHLQPLKGVIPPERKSISIVSKVTVNF